MDPARFFVRRANLDDLPGLKTLWEHAGMQVLEMEKHLTEFQLVASLEGDLVGAVALRVEGKQGLLHSEAFLHPEEEDSFRPLLWERLKILARNRGLVRIWTREFGPYWHKEAGFNDPHPADFQKFPQAFGDPHVRWLTLGLREENPSSLSVEREFELFQQASRASMEQVMDQTRRLRVFAFALAGILFVLVFGLGVYLAFRWMRDGGIRPGRAR
jgi:N-acetylglutamate synthase-like GNAT family acetyltransferase